MAGKGEEAILLLKGACQFMGVQSSSGKFMEVNPETRLSEGYLNESRIS